jgi:hypothetical protein
MRGNGINQSSERIVGYPYKGRGTGVFDKLSPDGPFPDQSSDSLAAGVRKRAGTDSKKWPGHSAASD